MLDRPAYRSYRRRQARALLELVPRDAVRPLYARAREWARAAGAHDVKDPMETLVRYCEEILPLPPFEIWRDDLFRHSERHLSALLASGGHGDPERDSLPIETREFIVDGARWHASLSLFQAEGAWRGVISFHRASDPTLLRTAGVFREDEPEDVRSRFLDLDGPSLRAFLRSVRP